MIKFTKMHGLGNDYVYIDCTKRLKIRNEAELAKLISNRHFGIGSDGMILICRSDVADFKMKMLNSDGTEAEMCGNGIRCLGKFVYDRGLTRKKELQIETLAGIKKLKLNIKEYKVVEVEVDMGEPILEANKIPVLSTKYPVKNLLVKIEDREFYLTCVSMGNPHCVIMVKNLNSFDVKRYGEILENYSIFPQRANIEFIQIVDKKYIKMRVWERGTGETLACGTGACAAVVACSLNNYIGRESVVELLGGRLKIRWDLNNNHVYMTGPAETVYDGEWFER